ncbi:MAG TPA: riboflavin synthase [Steroidobacteraceae bacterium]|nr:riboflavin synthase [Steroidobacteraceae bacterium]
MRGQPPMFTGIVQDVGSVVALEPQGEDRRVVIAVERLDLGRVAVGDSISVQGCCVTAVALEGQRFSADLSRETLAVTTLGQLQPGARVNLEPALRAGDALGGHLVSGHVDGVARVLARASDARSLRLTIEAPAELARYLARKGSVAIDGVSLTVNEIEGARFGVNLIPHTQAATTLGALAAGATVNLEVDPIARYLERLLLDSGQLR